MALDMKAFRKRLSYAHTGPSSTVLSDLGAIARLDEHAQQKKKKFSTLAWSSFAATILFLIVAVMIAEVSRAVAIFFFALMPIAFILCIVFTVILRYWSRVDVPDVRHKLPKQLLDMLGRDMEKGASTNLGIDFSSPTQRRKKTHSGPHPYRRGWKRDYFEDGWLSLQGRLLDGTTYTFKTNEIWIRSHGWKRSRSGKRKHKSKIKPKALELDLFLHFSRKRYGAVSVLEKDITDAIKLPTGVQLKKIKVDDHKMGLRVKIGPSDWSGFNPQLVSGTATSMFLSLYHVLNLAQKLSKAAN